MVRSPTSILIPFPSQSQLSSGSGLSSTHRGPCWWADGKHTHSILSKYILTFSHINICIRSHMHTYTDTHTHNTHTHTGHNLAVSSYLCLFPLELPRINISLLSPTPPSSPSCFVTPHDALGSGRLLALLQDHSWWDSGDRMKCQRWNRGWLRSRQVPSQLCSLRLLNFHF